MPVKEQLTAGGLFGILVGGDNKEARLTGVLRKRATTRASSGRELIHFTEDRGEI
jgi:hypothetical protein